MFPVNGIDKWVLSTFQIIFAVTTLLPILIYIYVDTLTMIYRARKRIRNERERSLNDSVERNVSTD